MKTSGLARFVSTLAALVALGSGASAAVIKVPKDHSTIQAAVNVAQAGDVVWVAQGTYTENVTLKPSIKLEGGYKSDYSARNWTQWPAVIDGAGKGPVVTGAHQATLDGFTLRHGKAKFGGGLALERAAMTIQNNTIEDNAADSGGAGIYLGEVPAAPPYTDVTNNTIRRNEILTDAGGFGAGILVSRCAKGVRITKNTIGGKSGDGNTARWGGGGIAVEATAVFDIEDNTISQNLGGTGHGGGVMITAGSPQANLGRNVISYNTISGNFGGGVYSVGGTAIFRNLVRGNTVVNLLGKGGGLAIDSATGHTPPRIENNMVSGNAAERGGGVYVVCGDYPILMNNTIVGNTPDKPDAGAGLFVQADARCIVQNNILWGNGDDFREETAGACILDHNDIEDADQVGQLGNISANPLFVASDDLHLQQGSPALDVGNPAAAPTLDFDGDARPAAIDIGADERRRGDLPCAFRTAARQSGLAAYTGDVREFRDTWLRPSRAGRAGIALYYAASPGVCRYLEAHESARVATRWAMTPAVLAVARPQATLAVLLGLALVGVGVRKFR